MTVRRVVDITYLAHWPGRLTGIPRVIDEYVRRAAQDENAVFVVWERETARFVSVDPLLTVELHGHGIQYLTRSTRGIRIASALRYGGAGRVSRELRDRAVRRGSVRTMALARRAARLRAAEHVVVEPAAGDSFVTFMGEWHDQDYIDEVLAVHARGAVIVQFCYDLLPILTPQYSGHSTAPMLSYYSQVMPVASMILAISEHTRRDLLTWAETAGIALGRVEVFRLGDDFGTDRTAPAERGNVPLDVEEDTFVLCVGTVEARKNHVLLYYVYRLALARGIALPRLVIVGRKGWRAGDIFDLLRQDPALEGHVSVFDDIDDAGLAWLYRNCRFTVYPSIYEGWGLPIAESLAWGKPVIASNTSSMPEIAGDLIPYFNPFSVEECLQAFTALTDHRELAAATAKLREYRPTSWSSTVAALNDLMGIAERL